MYTSSQEKHITTISHSREIMSLCIFSSLPIFLSFRPQSRIFSSQSVSRIDRLNSFFNPTGVAQEHFSLACNETIHGRARRISDVRPNSQWLNFNQVLHSPNKTVYGRGILVVNSFVHFRQSQCIQRPLLPIGLTNSASN